MPSLPPLVSPTAELTRDEIARYSRHLIIPDFGAAPLWLVSSWIGPVQVVLPLPGDCPGRVGIVKKSDNSSNFVTVTLPSGSGPDNGAVVLRATGDHVFIISNGAAWHIVSRHYDTPIGGWTNPSGSALTRGPFNADELENVGFSYDRTVVNNINYRLHDTRAVLRALIMDLKMKGILGD